MYHPKKTTYATIQYVDFPAAGESFGKGDGPGGKFITELARMDALIHVVRAFEDETVPHPEVTIDPARDIATMDLELAFADLAIIEKRLQRIDKAMSSEARDMFGKYVPDGDLAKYARQLPGSLRSDFVDAMKLLRDDGFQELLVSYPRPQRTFMKAYEQTDNVSSIYMFRDISGHEYNPEDYLQVFQKFVTENEDHIDAVKILSLIHISEPTRPY